MNTMTFHTRCCSENLKGKRPHRRPRSRWKDDIKIALMQIEYEGVDWSHMIQDTDQWHPPVNLVMNISDPKWRGI